MISKPNRIATAAAGLALAAIFAGCGEKEEPATTGAQVTTQTTTTTTTTTPDPPVDNSPIVVDQFLSSPNAAKVCDELLTPKFLRKAYGDRAGCLAARKPSTLAKPDTKQRVRKLQESGTLSIASPVGGVYDGQKLRIILIEDGGAYLIDSVKSNVPVGP